MKNLKGNIRVFHTLNLLLSRLLFKVETTLQVLLRLYKTYTTVLTVKKKKKSQIKYFFKKNLKF